jgi:hypothetical protein
MTLRWHVELEVRTNAKPLTTCLGDHVRALELPSIILFSSIIIANNICQPCQDYD